MLTFCTVVELATVLEEKQSAKHEFYYVCVVIKTTHVEIDLLLDPDMSYGLKVIQHMTPTFVVWMCWLPFWRRCLPSRRRSPTESSTC